MSSRECGIEAGSTLRQGFDIKIIMVWDYMRLEKKSQKGLK
jgi:hypothetical protein